MTPKEYYYNQFRKDFENFWNRVPHRSNYVTSEPIFKFSGLVKDDGSAIDPLNRNLDALKDIKLENLVYFLSALACTILIDQVMYTYFKEDYPNFQKLTLYPKMEIGWINANPWMVFHQNVRLPRNLHKAEVFERFSEFIEFFIKDLKIFFNENKFQNTDWKKVRGAMLDDKDVTSGDYGKIFIKQLKGN